MQSAEGFPPVARADTRILILGSLPGQRSIAAQQYYAHPRNAFWSIMQELFEIHGAYEDRLLQLLDNKIALWDVLGSCVRPGSLDSSIDLDSARVNDFAAFLDAHRDIRLIAFNGKKAAQMFRRFVASDVVGREVELASLPSTSPAYAAMPFSGKLVAWRDALQAGEHAMRNGSRR
ncbi:MAG: DNA-deoxyinosine glycosylase [Woeseiaceae bacterium]